MQLTPKQLERVNKTIDIVEKGNLAVAKHIFQLEEHVDQKIDELKAQIPVIPELIKSIRGKDGESIKGDKGDKPILGVDYNMPKDGINGKDGKTPTKRELISMIKPLIPSPISGLDGIDGKDGINGTNGKDGKDGSPDTAEQIVAKINDLSDDSDFKIDAIHIKNLPKSEIIRMPGGNGTQPVKAGTGVSITYDGNGAPVINVSNASAGYQLTTSGSVDGANKDFVFATAPNVICSDGLVINKTSSDGTINWTGTTTITMTIAPTINIFGIA